MLRPAVPAVLAVLALACAAAHPARAQEEPPRSIARTWNEALLEAIRNDLARPTVHARNLFHTSIAMWDAWAAYDPDAATYLHHERATAEDVAEARRVAISHAAYGVLRARFARSPGAAETLPALDARMRALGLDPEDASTSGSTPVALGNRVAESVLAFGRRDGANEREDYRNRHYRPVNPPLVPALPGNPSLRDPNRWQPLALDFFVDQAGNVVPGGAGEFLGAEWGAVVPFALTPEDRTTYERDGAEWIVHHDPGPPPRIGGVGHDDYLAGFTQVLHWSAKLDPASELLVDIGPGARGGNTLGTNDGRGHALNPRTGQPYAPNVVLEGDYFRVLAEFWADGPDSETPPGHWFTIANGVCDHPDLVRRIGGVGPELDPLEWDVKLYLALGGAVHDAAVAAWGVKGWYDYVRPISAIRYMADHGQSSRTDFPRYHPHGLPMQVPLVFLHLGFAVPLGFPAGGLGWLGPDDVDEMIALAWRGPDFVDDPRTTTAGVGYIRADAWWPYQRPSFVTPPFAGYVSGHSTFSRAAAELLAAFTGDPWFPGGVGEFAAPRDEFLVFEDGPSQDVVLQWATYFDAADECSLSRIYGGIHPPADDIPGRLMGAVIGRDAFARAQRQFAPSETLLVRKARARPRRGRRGIVRVHGLLDLGASAETFDPSRGVAVTLDFGGDRFGAGVAAASDLRTRRGGRTVVRAADGALRGTLREATTPAGGPALLVDVTVRVARYGDPEVGPLRVRVHTADDVRTGVAPDCRRRGRRRAAKLDWSPADDAP